MDAPVLRHGGLPLMGPHTPWPRCAACRHAMRFRAQVPLALTLVAPPDDPRMLLVFECAGCRAAEALLVSGPLSPRRPERASVVSLEPCGARLLAAPVDPPEAEAVWASVGPEPGGEPRYCRAGHRLRPAVRLWPQRLDGERLGAVRVSLCLRCGEALAEAA